MSTIGHNQPPPHEAMSLHIEDLFQLISDTTEGAEVKTDEQEAALANLLDDIRQARKDADAQRVLEKRPHDEAAKAVQALWKPLLDRCDAAANEIKAKLTPYRTAKQKAADEAARKAREEAEAREAAAREALQSDILEQRFDAEQSLKAAKRLKVQANKVDRAPTGLRTYTVRTVTDHRAALVWIAKNDKPALDGFIEEYARRCTLAMDGVEVTEEKRAA